MSRKILKIWQKRGMMNYRNNLKGNWYFPMWKPDSELFYIFFKRCLKAFII